MSDFYNHIFLISYVFTATPWLVSDSINEMQSSVSVYYWFNFTRNPNNTTAAHWFYKSWKNISTYRVSQKIFVRLILFSDLLLEIYNTEKNGSKIMQSTCITSYCQQRLSKSRKTDLQIFIHFIHRKQTFYYAYWTLFFFVYSSHIH